MGGSKPVESSEHRGYAFGPFVLDQVKRTLWRGDRLVPITSKTFDVLVVLQNNETAELQLTHYKEKRHGHWVDTPHHRAAPVHMIFDETTRAANWSS